MKPETRFKYFVDRISPLAGFLERFKPTARSIAVHESDWRLLRKEPELAGKYGFVVDGERVLFRGFELRPTASGCHKNARSGETNRAS